MVQKPMDGRNGAPVTTMINVHSNVDFIPGTLGFQVYQDEIGQESNTMVKLGYAYRLSPLSNGAHVGIGHEYFAIQQKL